MSAGRGHYTVSLVIGLAVVIAGVVAWAARPAAPFPTPLDLASVPVAGGETVRNLQGQVVLTDFRAIEPAVLYRAAGFPESRALPQPLHDGDLYPSLADESIFEQLRRSNVRHVVALQSNKKAFDAERGYFDYWAQRTGYRITTHWLPVDEQQIYNKDEHGALHAAAEVLATMKSRKAGDGAVLVHGDNLETAGIVEAAFQLWRSRGHLDSATLWQQIAARFIYPQRLEQVRPELFLIAEI